MQRRRDPDHVRYVNRFVANPKTPYARQVLYLRLPGRKKVELPGPFKSEIFWISYQNALAGTTAPVAAIGADRVKAGSIAALVASFKQTPRIAHAARASRAKYLRILDKIVREHGALKVADWEHRHVAKAYNDACAGGHRFAALDLLKMLKRLFDHAIRENLRRDNPAVAIERVSMETEGHHTPIRPAPTRP